MGIIRRRLSGARDDAWQGATPGHADHRAAGTVRRALGAGAPSHATVSRETVAGASPQLAAMTALAIVQYGAEQPKSLEPCGEHSAGYAVRSALAPPSSVTDERAPCRVSQPLSAPRHSG